MRFSYPSRAKKRLDSFLSRGRSSLPDILWTTLVALEESADGFPLLKGAVGGVIAICHIAERARHCNEDACTIALRTVMILGVVVGAVPSDGSRIPGPMLRSIERFSFLLKRIYGEMVAITSLGRVSRILHLNRNEASIRRIKLQLDDAYRDFMAAATVRFEVGQFNTHIAVKKLSSDTAAATSRLEVELEMLSENTKSLGSNCCFIPNRPLSWPALGRIHEVSIH
ncbi:hypothetical protein B0H19DRAFT_1067830 [Mycena capillaripes]|nr:hypothetical protein B0H19DRAFT_1067830 [Mycena capillaripes]